MLRRASVLVIAVVIGTVTLCCEVVCAQVDMEGSFEGEGEGSPIQPVNDLCANAIPVLMDVAVSGTLAGATGPDITPCLPIDEYTDLYDVWYSFTPPSDGWARAYLNAESMPTVAWVDFCGGTVLTWDFNYPSIPVTKNMSYLIRVADCWSVDFTLSVSFDYAPPSNDTCDNATQITEGVPVSGTLLGATDERVDSYYGYFVWYKFSPCQDGMATVNLYDYSTFTAALYILEGCGETTLAFNFNSYGDGTVLTIPVDHVASYLIGVRLNEGKLGDFSIRVQMADGGGYSFERMWPALQQPWYFAFPTDVAVSPSGTVYVLDSGNNRIQAFTNDGTFLNVWKIGNFSYGNYCYYIAAGPDGSVYVADLVNRCIQKFASSGAFVTKWGSEGSGDGQFNTLWGVAVGPDGSVYVADSGNDCIQKFTADGVFINKWGEDGTGDGQFQYPQGVAVGTDGSVYVAADSRIQKFTGDGVFITTWGSYGTEDGQFDDIRDVAVGSDGSVFVTDGEFQSRYNNRIQKFTTDGVFIGKWGADGAGEGQFSFLRGVAVGLDGAIYVADSSNNCIQKFTTGGAFQAKWGSSGSNDGHFLSPNVSVNALGELLVADRGNHRIQKFDADGQFLLKWGGKGDGDGQFNTPYDIAAGASGNLYVADSKNHRIQKFTADGVFVSKWGSEGSGEGQLEHPRSVAVDSSENVYVADYYNYRIQKFTGNGEYLKQWGFLGKAVKPVDVQLPLEVAVDVSGNVYVAWYNSDWFATVFYKYDANGAFQSEIHHGQQWVEDPYAAGICVDALNNVYFLENKCIHGFDTHGILIDYWCREGIGPDQLSGANNLAVDSLGNLYTASNYNCIQKFKKGVHTQNSKAIIVAGGGVYPGNNLWGATQMCANFAYRTLTYQGFTKADMYYLSSDVDLDLDSNGVADDVDGDATLLNLQYALTQWGPEQTNCLPTSNVLVYLVDHGGDGMFRMNATETLSATDLASWLNTLQSGIQGILTVVYDACESGSFIQVLKAPDGYADKRVIMASTEVGMPANFVTQGSISFSNLFWTHMFNGLDLYNAFTLTSDSLGLSVDQTPLLEADGDGVPNQAGDFQAVQNRYVGNGTVLNSAVPVIDAVTPAQNLTDTSTAALWAEGVTDEEGIARVWAIIRPPDYMPPASGNPVQSLPQVELWPTATEGRYEGTFDQFTSQGIYHIAIYARDRSLNTSIPKVTTVSVDSPLSRRAVIVAGGSPIDPTWNAVERGVQGAYRALSYQGYTAEDIYFLCPLGIEGVDGLPVLSNVEHALTDWVGADTQDLVLYLAGNGGDGTFLLNDTEALPVSVLDSWLNALQGTLPGVITVVYDACRSGSFVPLLTPPSGKNRIVITSTGASEAAFLDAKGDASFSSYFWSRILNGASVANAFSGARQAMQIGGAGPDAQLDDNGNGIGNEKMDGILARSYTLGAGVMLAGDDPVIGAIVSEQVLSGWNDALLWVDHVTTTGALTQVWALITPPNFTPQGLCGGDFSLPIVDLVSVGGGRYEAAYAGFTDLGRYHVAVYAMDANGSLSLPAETDLFSTVSNVPDAYEPDNTSEEASWIGINGPNQTHTLHVVNDEDWARFYGKAGQEVTVETLDLGVDCDTYLEVYRGDELTPFATNDDENPGILRSYIRFTVTDEGMYYARVQYSTATPFPGGAEFDTRYTLAVWEEQGILSATLMCGVTTSDSEPILNASVRLEPLNITVTENVNGIYSFLALPSGVTCTVSVEALGYGTWSGAVLLQAGETKSLSIVLEPENEGEGTIEGTLEGEIQEGEGASDGEGLPSEGSPEEGEPEGTVTEGESGVYAADQNADGLISLSELLRVIQFYNSGGFHCEAGTEDGYAPDPGVETCTPHASDYNPHDWHINLSELLRLIQFYNSGGYHSCSGTEDGFCPGL